MNVSRTESLGIAPLVRVSGPVSLIPVLALSLVSFLPGCARRPPAVTALTMAQRKVAETKDQDKKLVLLTDIAVALLRHDPPKGKALLSEAHRLALSNAEAGPTARVYAIAQRAFALSALDPPSATAILTQAVDDAERVYPPSRSEHTPGDSPIMTPGYLVMSASNQYDSLLAALATSDPDGAVARAGALPPEQRSPALAAIAESIARSDVDGAARLMERALESPRPTALSPPDWLWRDLCIAGAPGQPRKAMSLAGAKLRPSRERAQVLEWVVAALTHKGRPAVEQVIAQETNPVMRAWGWLSLAHQSRGEERDSAIRRAAETLEQAKLSELDRSTAVTEWCLLAVLAHSAETAMQYLDAAESAQHIPPLDYERGMVLAAACYVDHPRAMKIHQELLAKRRDGPDRRSVNSVLTCVNHVVARVDVDTAKRTVTDAPAWAHGILPAAAQLAHMAIKALPVAGKDPARRLVRAAERELAAQEQRVNQDPNNYQDQSSLPRAMETVALGLAALGDASGAFRLAGRIRDPGSAGQTYMAIAGLLESKPTARMDAFEALDSLARPMGLLSAPYEPAAPAQAP